MPALQATSEMRRGACRTANPVPVLRSLDQHSQSAGGLRFHARAPPKRQNLGHLRAPPPKTRMKNSETLLLVADSDHDANMLYAVGGMFVPDPFIYFQRHGRSSVVMSDLEIDRARKQARHCRVLSLSSYQSKLRREGVKYPGVDQVLPRVLREKGIRRVVVPHDFPQNPRQY